MNIYHFLSLVSKKRTKMNAKNIMKWKCKKMILFSFHIIQTKIHKGHPGNYQKLKYSKRPILKLKTKKKINKSGTNVKRLRNNVIWESWYNPSIQPPLTCLPLTHYSQPSVTSSPAPKFHYFFFSFLSSVE